MMRRMRDPAGSSSRCSSGSAAATVPSASAYHPTTGRCLAHPQIQLRKPRFVAPGSGRVLKWSVLMGRCPHCVFEAEEEERRRRRRKSDKKSFGRSGDDSEKSKKSGSRHERSRRSRRGGDEDGDGERRREERRRCKKKMSTTSSKSSRADGSRADGWEITDDSVRRRDSDETTAASTDLDGSHAQLSRSRPHRGWGDPRGRRASPAAPRTPPRESLQGGRIAAAEVAEPPERGVEARGRRNDGRERAGGIPAER